MVRNYFTARYIAKSLDIELAKARHKLANERRFSKAELETIEETSGIAVKDLLAGSELYGSDEAAFAEELTDR